ncbi:MAG: hypothetical protein ACRCTW_11155 [Lactococcus garvieae]
MLRYRFTNKSGKEFHTVQGDQIVLFLQNQGVDLIEAINMLHYAMIAFMKRLELGYTATMYECKYGVLVIMLNVSQIDLNKPAE